ncbi:MAG: hypothetical protein ACI9KE_004162 [Polyangiales bacterium]|jgi:hypothetical protein
MFALSSRFAFAVCLVVSFACGSSTQLNPYQDPDSGVDSGPGPDVPGVDVGPDVPDASLPDVGPDVFDAGPTTLDVTCSIGQMVRPGESATVSAELISPTTAPLTHRWSVVEGDAAIESPNQPVTTVASMVPGRHILRYSVQDATGAVGSCTTTVAVVNGPPIASCPFDPVVGPAGMPIVVEGQGFDDDGIVNYQWDLIEGDLEIFEPGQPTTTVLSRRAQTHQMRLTVTDTDGAEDSCIATVRTTAPPVLRCPATIEAPTRQPVDLAVQGRDDTSIVRHEWSGIAWPDDDIGVEFVSIARNRATMVPRRRGTYLINYTATDDDGLSSSCVIEVIALPTPPTLSCPSEVVGAPLTPVSIEASAVDDGDIIRWDWELSGRPDGSNARPPSTGSPTSMFTPDVAGRYEVFVTATDDDGMQDTCVIAVLAVSDQGLRIEVSWDTATDMDTHLLNPQADEWEQNDDCYYGNRNPEWGVAGVDDNPRLDIDDTDGFGPENINIDVPENGVFRAGILAFRGRANVTMRIYCGGSRLEPALTIGPVAIGNRDLWRAADIEIDGFECTIEELFNPDGTRDIDTNTSRR